jgi:hypothetical protein
MIRDELWSVSISRIRAFFDTQPNITPTDTGYQYGNCLITLTEVPPKDSARFPIPRTQVVFDGSDTDVSDIYHRFMIQFLTAGG